MSTIEKTNVEVATGCETTQETAAKAANIINKTAIADYLDNYNNDKCKNYLLAYVDKSISEKNYGDYRVDIYDDTWYKGVFGKTDDYRHFRIRIIDKTFNYDTQDIVVKISDNGVEMTHFQGFPINNEHFQSALQPWGKELITDIQAAIANYHKTLFKRIKDLGNKYQTAETFRTQIADCLVRNGVNTADISNLNFHRGRLNINFNRERDIPSIDYAPYGIFFNNRINADKLETMIELRNKTRDLLEVVKNYVESGETMDFEFHHTDIIAALRKPLGDR